MIQQENHRNNFPLFAKRSLLALGALVLGAALLGTGCKNKGGEGGEGGASTGGGAGDKILVGEFASMTGTTSASDPRKVLNDSA